MPKRELQDIGTPVSSTRRGFLLAFVLIAVAFVATIVLIRPWTGSNVAITEVSAVGAAQIQVAERPPMNHPTQEALQDVREERNPALQKSGPPDTEAEASAAASAERAAQAAADLAANQ